VKNSILVVVNSPPSQGSFDVTPNNGVEIVQNFVLAANHWQDSNLPLTYQFGIVSASQNFVVL
jgi:hypothetical protein